VRLLDALRFLRTGEGFAHGTRRERSSDPAGDSRETIAPIRSSAGFGISRMRTREERRAGESSAGECFTLLLYFNKYIMITI